MSSSTAAAAASTSTSSSASSSSSSSSSSTAGAEPSISTRATDQGKDESSLQEENGTPGQPLKDEEPKAQGKEKEDEEKEKEEEEDKLPPLSAAEFRHFNRLAEHMEYFHNHFRHEWNVLYNASTSGRRPQGMSLRAFINTGLQLVSHLDAHHSIEESYVFPELAKRMPEFRTGKENLGPDPNNSNKDKNKTKNKKAAELLQQHKEIHKGMDGLKKYLNQCLSGESDLEMSALKAQLDTWGTVLWTHLDQEVRTLAAENMRRYWTLEEVKRIAI